MSDIHPKHRHLPRLPPEFYEGFAYVHWSMTINQRKSGWLNDDFHFRFREVLLQTLWKYDLFCPIYVLMPDHMHLLWMGMSETSDQKKATPFFRRHINRLLTPFRLQDEAFDSVLKEKDRERGAFQAVVHYIYENPVREKIVEEAEDYPYSDCLLPGYPEVSFRDPNFWDRFWRIFIAAMERIDDH